MINKSKIYRSYSCCLLLLSRSTILKIIGAKQNITPTTYFVADIMYLCNSKTKTV